MPRILIAAVAVAALFATPFSANAEEAPTYRNGFSVLHDSLGERMGAPAEDEHLEGDVVVQRTHSDNADGLAVWSDGQSTSWTNGWLHAEIVNDRVVEWEGDVMPVTNPSDPAQYILTHSRYGQRAVCVSRIETGKWSAYWNPTPVGRWHAYGYFGWLQPTWDGIALWGQPMNLAAEVEAFDRMLDHHRGNEFAGILSHAC